MSLKLYPSNCAHGLDVPPVQFIMKDEILYSVCIIYFKLIVSTTIFPYQDFSMMYYLYIYFSYNMICFISAAVCLLIVQIIYPLIPKSDF